MSAKLFLMTWLELFGVVYSRNVHLQMEEANGFEVRNIREYFIAAEKVKWDYLPMGTDPHSGNNSGGPTKKMKVKNFVHPSKILHCGIRRFYKQESKTISRK
ncbi:hypothetical protein CHS0354_029839 [Potamilus streckersoni]|uniref:Uncharacterized protein n=1 Tax=Potamilus streckersoni TaxID=2493646 RepID=A0AAE0TG91_9BIVA|nr:hypothetical protein CHS0354_029839 [Potamilus streckersoni]